MKLPAPGKALLRRVLARVLTEPTAPYHEHRVRNALALLLKESGVPTKIDAYGNLVARYESGRARPVAYAAHMDHPGLEITQVRGRRARARWNGQVPTFDLRGEKIAIWSDRADVGRRGAATVTDGDGRRKRSLAAKIRLDVPAGTRAGDFGYADLAPLKFYSGRIVSKALDNVGGCAAIAAALLHLAENRLPGDVRALFTRAEEVGFLGAFAAIERASVPKSRPLIVLECSKELPGAVMGGGPVLRVGDRLRLFDADLLYACETAASRIKKARPSFKFQRRLMDGGACESSAFELAGYRTICLAFPLGNYHNVGPRAVAEEYIAEEDFQNGVLCLAGIAALGVDPAASRKELAARLARRFTRRDRAKLKASAS